MVSYLGDGVDGVPALVQHFRIGVVEQPHEAGEQRASVSAVVEACSGEVSVQDSYGCLPQPRICSPRGLQEILDDDPLTNLILHGQNHSLTAAQLLQKENISDYQQVVFYMPYEEKLQVRIAQCLTAT